MSFAIIECQPARRRLVDHARGRGVPPRSLSNRRSLSTSRIGSLTSFNTRSDRAVFAIRSNSRHIPNAVIDMVYTSERSSSSRLTDFPLFRMIVPTVDANLEASRSVRRGPVGVTFNVPCCSWQLLSVFELIVIFRFPPQSSAPKAPWGHF